MKNIRRTKPEMERLQAETATDLDAKLLAILDGAFKGEL